MIIKLLIRRQHKWEFVVNMVIRIMILFVRNVAKHIKRVKIVFLEMCLKGAENVRDT